MMPMRCGFVSFLVLLILWFGPVEYAGAAGGEEIYSASVVIEDESVETRESATRFAMGVVLIRVTGRRSIISDEVAVDLIDSAKSRVLRHRNLTEGDRTLLRVDFDPAAVDQAVSALGLPVWGRERPTVLVWLAVDNRNGDRFILTPDGDPDLVEIIQGTADNRGLPVLLPLYDAEDSNLVSFADIWGGFSDSVQTASRRYGADAILVGRARTRGRAWEVRWLLIDDTQRQTWVGGFSDGIHQAADSYAQAFAVTETKTEALVSIVDVGSFSDYGRVLQYLNGLSVVEQVEVVEARESVLVFRLGLRGDVAVLQRAMRLGRVLEPLSVELPSAVLGPPQLRYQYRP